MFIKKCDFKCIQIFAKCDTVQNTVVTSLLLVFDYHARNTLTLYYLCWDYLIKTWIKYIKLSVSIKLFMSCFIAHDYVCTASKLLCFNSSDYLMNNKYFCLWYKTNNHIPVVNPVSHLVRSNRNMQFTYKHYFVS